MTMADSELLNVKQVADLLRTDTNAVLRWVKLGRIQPVRVKQAFRFRRSQVLDAMESATYGSNPGRDPAMG